MEWIREHIAWLIPIISATVGALAWLLRLESRVGMNTKSITTLELSHDRHINDSGRHAGAASVAKLEETIQSVKDEMVETRKSIELKMDEVQRQTREDLRDLFNKVYDQK